MYVTQDEILKLLIAVGIGGLLGFEREIHAKAAGLRTLTLITVGATLFTMLSSRFPNTDPARVASNIVTGVGFLGAGAILLSEGKVKGLTTASSIWAAAALGMAIGIGEFALAGAAAVIIVAILWLFARLDLLIDVLGRDLRVYDITYMPVEKKFEQIEQAIRECGLKPIRKRRMKVDKGLMHDEWELRGALARHNLFTERLLNDPEIVELKY